MHSTTAGFNEQLHTTYFLKATMKLNPLHILDFYKTGHVAQYEPGTQSVYSNFTARSDRLAPVLRSGMGAFEGKVVFYGLQGFIQEFLIDLYNDNFFKQPKAQVLKTYKRRMDAALGVGAVKLEHIAALHDLGYLPIVIKALPEGSRVDLRVPMFTVKETRREFYWLTNYLETLLSQECWKPITVATLAYEMRRLLLAYAKKTGADVAFVDWQGHDFSARGMSGAVDSARTGSAHLTSFYGTDTVSALDYLEYYYSADADEALLGGSVPATEHSVMSMGGSASEIETFRRLITQTYPSGIVSIVSDTWDYWQVLSDYTVKLKAEILARKPNDLGQAKVVFRPDSGDPVRILAGYTWYEVEDAHNQGELRYELKRLFAATTKNVEAVKDKKTGKYFRIDWAVGGSDARYNLVELQECEVKGSVEVLWDIFGGTETALGYKVLNERVGLIYGDSITLARAQEILERLAAKGFASSNVVFGVGSYTYQYLSRDTFGMAMKATWGVVNGQARELSKDPKTDSGTKKSAVGLLRVEKEGDKFVLHDRQTPEQEAQGELREVFRDSRLTRIQTFAEIRACLREGEAV